MTGDGETAGEEFVVARNPDPDSALPYLIRLPLQPRAVVLKARDAWPRTTRVYCHPAPGWPEAPDVLERVRVRSCVRRGAAIDLVLDRGRESRSQVVFTRIRGGRQAIFWQTARTARQARPSVGVPLRRSAAGRITILVDVHERYPWRFARQQADALRRPLAIGDYGVEDAGVLVAAVERKSLGDLVTSLTTGRLRYALAALSSLRRAALVIEERYSSVFRLEHVRPSVVANGIAELQVRFPSVPIVFTETRALAEEWTYRFLGAALDEVGSDRTAELMVADLPGGGPIPRAAPATAAVRAWARGAGLAVSDRGRLRPEVWDAYEQAQSGASGSTRAASREPPQRALT